MQCLYLVGTYSHIIIIFRCLKLGKFWKHSTYITIFNSICIKLYRNGGGYGYDGCGDDDDRPRHVPLNTCVYIALFYQIYATSNATHKIQFIPILIKISILNPFWNIFRNKFHFKDSECIELVMMSASRASKKKKKTQTYYSHRLSLSFSLLLLLDSRIRAQWVKEYTVRYVCAAGGAFGVAVVPAFTRLAFDRLGLFLFFVCHSLCVVAVFGLGYIVCRMPYAISIGR